MESFLANYTLREIQLVMTAGAFGLGVISFISGVLILIFSSSGRNTRAIAEQTTRLAQKGMAEEVAGLVGNASALLSAMNGMVNTTAGIGVYITLIGTVMMVASFVLVFQIK